MKTFGLLFALTLGCTAGGPPARAAERAAAPAPAVAGTKAEGQGFVVEVKAPAEAKVGSAAVAKVVLHPTGGYHVNKEFPTALTVTTPAGVDLPKAKMLPADAAKFGEDEAIFDVTFTAKDGGDKKFEATFKFAVCTAETCDPKLEKLAWTVVSK